MPKSRRIVHVDACNFVGNPGHGSRFIENTAAAKVQYLMNKLLGFREEQRVIYESDDKLTLGTFISHVDLISASSFNFLTNFIHFLINFDHLFVNFDHLQIFFKKNSGPRVL